MLLPQLRAKPVRTASGIAVVAVMSKPHRCPHIATTGARCRGVVWCCGAQQFVNRPAACVKLYLFVTAGQQHKAPAKERSRWELWGGKGLCAQGGCV